MAASDAAAVSREQAVSNPTHSQHASYASDIDQQCWASEDFWQCVSDEMPGYERDPALERFRGFCHNLRTKTPGSVTVEDGRELLEQYTFPGLPPSKGFFELDELSEKAPYLKKLEGEEFVAIAREELSATLGSSPLHDDERPPTVDELSATPWVPAAWKGWQFLPLRAAGAGLERTRKTVRQHVPYAHRFVGIARQGPNSRGAVHSDRRNYMLSTLTGLEGTYDCGIVVDGEDKRIEMGKTLVVDNTFLHQVYNNAEVDRFVLMVEVWSPALTKEERKAMRTLFALKDMYSAVVLQAAPWGVNDEAIYSASDDELLQVGFWADICR